MRSCKELYQDLSEIVDPSLLRSSVELQNMDPGIDRENLSGSVAVLVESAEQIGAIVAYCNAQDVPLVPQGGRTGLCGGAVSHDGEIILMMDRMNRVESFDIDGGVAVVEAAVKLETLNELLLKNGWTVGIDLGARGSATIGGMVSTNAGGNEAFRNGVMRHRVLGLEAVMADGSMFNDLSKVTKNNDGYDIKQLLIGSEGTLGIVTKIALKLELEKAQPITALCTCDSAKSAVNVFNRFRRDKRFQLLSAECMWREHARTVAEELSLNALANFIDDEVCLLLEIEQPATSNGVDQFEQQIADAVENGEVSDALIAKNETERNDFWRIREDWAAEKKYPHGFWYDISVPLSVIDDYVQDLLSRLEKIDPAFHVFVIGHLGDGNLHLSITTGKPQTDATHHAVNEAVFFGLKESGGAISAEHGIGLEKRELLPNYCCPTKYALMKSIKQIFDPNNILNRGKVLQ